MFRKNLWQTAVAITALTMSLASQAHINYRHDTWRDAAAKGSVSDFYIGIQGQYVNTNWDDITDALEVAGIGTNAGARFDFNGPEFGARAFVRWDFSRYFGIEGGYSYINGANTEFVFNNIGLSPNVIISNPPSVGQTLLRGQVTTSIADLTWVTRIPLQNSFTFYTKFGVNLMLVKGGMKYRLINSGGVKRFVFSGEDNTNLSITFGLGFNYAFSDTWVGDLSYQHFRGNDSSRDFIADVNAFMAGIAYHIPLDTCPKSCL